MGKIEQIFNDDEVNDHETVYAQKPCTNKEQTGENDETGDNISVSKGCFDIRIDGGKLLLNSGSETKAKRSPFKTIDGELIFSLRECDRNDVTVISHINKQLEELRLLDQPFDCPTEAIFPSPFPLLHNNNSNNNNNNNTYNNTNNNNINNISSINNLI